MYHFIIALYIALGMMFMNSSSVFAVHNTTPEPPEWTPNVVHVKISADLKQQLDADPAKSPADFFSLAASELGTAVLQVEEMEQIFRPDPRFAQRHAESGIDRWYRLGFNGTLSTAEAVQFFSSNPEVELAEKSYLVSMPEHTVHSGPKGPGLENDAQEGSNDALFGQQWHYHNTGQLIDGQVSGTPGADINLIPAWELSIGSGAVTVLVIDSGIDTSHPDLVGALWINPVSGPDNGYEDDLHGWNFADDDNNIQDANSHGTHVSGTIAATTSNEIGVAGIAGGFGGIPGVKIMTARISSPGNWAFVGDIAAAFVYGADNGAVIANNSWVGGEASSVLDEAIQYFTDFAGFDAFGNYVGPVQGGVVVFSAGNGNTDSPGQPLVSNPSAIAVASTDWNDKKSGFSEYGGWIDVSAPGGLVLSTVLDGYAYLSGTSMAAPHVAGVAALIASYHPGLRQQEIKARLVVGVDDITTQNPEYVGMLGGRINALSALLLENDGVAPGRITDIETVGHVAENFANISWRAPGASNMEGLAYRYDIRISEEAITNENFEEAEVLTRLLKPLQPGMLQSFHIPDLSTATTYYVAIKTRDAFGNVSAISDLLKFTTDSSPAINVVASELDFELKLGQSVQEDIILENTGEGKLFFSFPLNMQPGAVKASTHPSLFGQYPVDPQLLSPDGIYRSGVVRDYLSGRSRQLPQGEQVIIDQHFGRAAAPGPRAANATTNSDLSTSLEFEELELQVFEFIKVSGPDKFGSLITVNPDFELTANSENFWASDLAIIFADGPDLFASNRLLQVGGYNLFANMAIFWEDGEAGKLGTTVRAPIDIPFDFDVENLYMFLINTYIPENQQASAAWSGSIELFGVEESASFITDVEPASGELEAGESVMVTLSFEPAELGLMESALYLTSNDLQQQAIIIPVSMNGLQSIDWASLHGPATATLSPGEDFDIKGRVLAESYTEDASPAQEVSYAVGFHSENTHPEDWPESAWVSGEFSTAMENMHEYSVVTGSHLEEGTWFYATRFEFDGEGYSYGGYADEGGGFWEEGQYISGIAEIAPATSTEPETELPAVVSLSQNYPNPFNPVTLIEYALPETAEVRLDVFNMMGQQVATLVNATQPAGEHAVSFDAAGLSSGMYLYRFSSGSFIQTRKMMLLK